MHALKTHVAGVDVQNIVEPARIEESDLDIVEKAGDSMKRSPMT